MAFHSAQIQGLCSTDRIRHRTVQSALERPGRPIRWSISSLIFPRGSQRGRRQNKQEQDCVRRVRPQFRCKTGAVLVLASRLHLHPLEWGQVRQLTGKGSPYIGEILNAGFDAAQAAVVLLTPDDEARLREPYRQEDDGNDETELTGQPRQNVLLEAGMAMGRYEDRTILVELGKMRVMSDVLGRHVVRLNDSPATRNELANRLRDAGCDVNTSGSDWYSRGGVQ